MWVYLLVIHNKSKGLAMPRMEGRWMTGQDFHNFHNLPGELANTKKSTAQQIVTCKCKYNKFDLFDTSGQKKGLFKS